MQILDIRQGGPCDKTNLQRGDVLVEINGISIVGMVPQGIAVHTMGYEGSVAILVAKRGAL